MTQQLQTTGHPQALESDSESARENYSRVAGLWVDSALKQFLDHEVLPNTGIMPLDFWRDFSELIGDLAPKNRGLLDTRNFLQLKIDEWHAAEAQSGKRAVDPIAYRKFLESIHYIAPEPENFAITTEDVDDEIARQAGPQLVVPLKNARFALNAANARWGSLYDAFYGTDAIADEGELARDRKYNPVRGAMVISKGREFLDMAAPLAEISHHDAKRYIIENGALKVKADDARSYPLASKEQFLGYSGSAQNPSAVLLQNHGLRFEIQIDNATQIGKTDKAGVKDILMEAALTTIVDCEDSVAAVDAEDKLEIYQNWLGLIKGTLKAEFKKGDTKVIRSLNPDREYTDPHGNPFHLPGRSLLFIRNVGHLMTNPAILYDDRYEIPEGIMDAVITSLIALHDIKFCGPFENSRKKSIYIVKPKMHGPHEVAFTNTLFERVEQMLDLKKASIKLGIMDEERRTSVNLKSCIFEAKERCVFINTGFLDRTGDEIHTSMYAGPMVPKTQMKQQAWINAYERLNVSVGLDCGFRGRAQIGKGMWPMPDKMADMLETKVAHPQSGANTAWVPSPTAAVLHAIHYHQISVPEQQKHLEQHPHEDAEECFDQLLKIPLIVDRSELSPDIIRAEIDNNCQGILGYVVRWIDQGIGCSKVPDINNVGLMEDRATLRISSQLLANWLLHKVCSEAQVEEALKRMALVVDLQNAGDNSYKKMSDNLEASIAFRAASDLIFKGCEQASGYTEPLLHFYRQQKKQEQKTQSAQKAPKVEEDTYQKLSNDTEERTPTT